MSNSFYFVVSDTDEQNPPINEEDLNRRKQEITALIPQPLTKEKDNNMRFVEKAFTLFKDCGFVTESGVKFLADEVWCNSVCGVKMNPLGAILRRKGLPMWDKNNLRYYCPYNELEFPSDIETAKTKTWNGKSKLAVVCKGVTYYISNDWFAADKSRPTKSAFATVLFFLAEAFCNSFWQKQAEKTKEVSLTNEDNSSLIPLTKEPDDLKAVLSLLNDLHKKIDNLNEKFDNLNSNLNAVADKLNNKTEILNRDLTQKIEDVTKEVNTLYKLWE